MRKHNLENREFPLILLAASPMPALSDTEGATFSVILPNIHIRQFVTQKRSAE
jgi:hypothetical protein